MKIHNKLFLAFIFILCITVLLTACNEQPFRLHVIANSDSNEDQQIKLMVRDAVLEATSSKIIECENAQEAEEYIKDNMQTILSAANEVLRENEAQYTANAFVGDYHFPEKTYMDVTYPEGDYHALRVVLGKGEGQNWWCVMFPPLCLCEIDSLGEDSELTEDVEYKSFFAELISRWLKKD